MSNPDGKFEQPTTRLRWLTRDNKLVLQQMWHISSINQNNYWIMKEEWRDVPNEQS